MTTFIKNLIKCAIIGALAVAVGAQDMFALFAQCPREITVGECLCNPPSLEESSWETVGLSD